jgi:hypothetical protein
LALTTDEAEAAEAEAEQEGATAEVAEAREVGVVGVVGAEAAESVRLNPPPPVCNVVATAAARLRAEELGAATGIKSGSCDAEVEAEAEAEAEAEEEEEVERDKERAAEAGDMTTPDKEVEVDDGEAEVIEPNEADKE